MKQSVLRDIQASQGAVFGPYHGWEIPLHFGDAQREYEAVRAGAGALDVGYAGKIRVTGRDRVKFLQNMLSNDIARLEPGSGCYATLLTHQGHMEADLFVYAHPEELWLECSPAATDRLLAGLERFIIADKVTLEDCTLAMGLISIQGPAADEKAASLPGFAAAGLPELGHRGMPERFVARRDRSGCGGCDIWAPAGEMVALWTALTGTGKVPPVGHEALNRLRTESGIPWYGADMDEKSLPMEFALDAALSMTKGCYRGQEIVARVLHRGHVRRKLAAVAVAGDTVPARGADVLVKGEKVGQVTSAAWSPRLGGPLALALLKTEFHEPATEVEVADGDRTRPGKVVALPLGDSHQNPQIELE